jgi:HlyD family secretion protein
MNVSVGDEVRAGAVLARSQIDRSPAELAADIASAELALLISQQNLEVLHANAELEAAQALITLEEAQLAFDELTDYELELSLAQQTFHKAEEAVQGAEMNLYMLNSSPSQEAVDIANASLTFKEKDLAEIEDRIAQVENQIKSAPNKTVRDNLIQQLLNLRVQLYNQQIDIDNALYKVNTMDDPPEAIDALVAEAQLTTAQAQLAEAQKDLEQAQTGPSEGDLAVAEAQLADAQADWERLKDGPDAEEIALAEAQLAKAEIKLDMVKGEGLVVDLVAPMDGIVLTINAAQGDRVDQGTILTLADLSQPSVQINFDEIDLEYIQTGYQAEVIFDAIPEATFNGQVVQVDPSLKRVGNTQAVEALVQLDGVSDRLYSLPMGLNATVDIIAGEAIDAVLVPLEALHQEDGGYFVYVINGSDFELREVEVGLMDLTSAEIIFGLRPGERVVIGDINFDQE